MFNYEDNSITVYTILNLVGCAFAYIMLAGSIWYAPVDFSTKGFWAMGIILLTISLINVVKYRFDERSQNNRIRKIEEAKNEQLLLDFAKKD